MPISHGDLSPSRISVADLAWLLDYFNFTRQIDAIHLHHSGRPGHGQYRGEATIREMTRHHVEGLGLSAVAQHLTIGPDGSIWLGRNWNLPPASAAGHNGNAVSGPMMVMLIGDFDLGGDSLDTNGHQYQQMVQAVARVQYRFGLVPESLRVESQISPGAGPAQGIDHEELVKNLRRERTALRKAEKEGAEFPHTSGELDRLRHLLDRFSRSDAIRLDDADAQLGENGVGRRDFNRFAGMGPTETEEERTLFGPHITPAMLDELAPHAVNLTMGLFSNDGEMETQPGDVDAIFEDHLVQALAQKPDDQPLRILFYAHGGLVGERVALMQAYQHVPWWRRNNVYPIYFIWETGFLPMFLESLRGTSQRTLARETITDGVVERLARAAGGPRVWQAIKSSAQTASQDPDGGARYLIGKLKEFLDAHGDQVELHAIGHSAGAIFHSFFVPGVVDATGATFRSVSLLAPAITVDDFKHRLQGYMGQGIDHLPIFTMRKELERKDPVASPWYNRSILYLVSHAMETRLNTPVLGLEESLRADSEMKTLFGLRGRPADHGEVIWTTTAQSTGRSASHAASHVDFNCDPPTMDSLLRRIIDADDNDPIQDYPTAIACRDRSLTTQVELPVDVARMAQEGIIHPRAFLAPTRQPNTHATATDSPMADQPLIIGPAPGGGRRRALCIGIDEYDVSPLGGCVADARLWAQTLERLGFERPAMLLNRDATRDAIIHAFEEIVTSSRAGDVVVIQFAGHGISLPDLDGDEADQDSPTDEALCPVDFSRGAYIIDDDIAQIFARTPAGVNITCFFDCCHSGTNTRFAVGSNRGPDPARQERARYLAATPERIDQHKRYRRDLGSSRSARPRGPVEMREVVFSACLSSEVALESNNQGHFTGHATRLLQAGINGVSNEQFHLALINAFGPARRQTPFLDSAPAARARMLLQPQTQAAPAAGGMSPALTLNGNPGWSNQNRLGEQMTAVELLQRMLAILEA